MVTFDSNNRLAMIARVFDTGTSTYAALVETGAGGALSTEEEPNAFKSLLVIDP